MKALISTLLVSLSLSLMAQQRPFINSIDRLSGTVGETITLTGSGFSANPADLKVFFGAGEGTIVSSTTTQIKVTVPGTATYDPITVVNTATLLSGSSSELFTMSYDGAPAITAARFDAVNTIATNNTFSYDLCICDFNNDGLLDFGVTHQEDQAVTFFQNQSTVDVTSFIKTDILNYASPYTTLGIDCGDLNDDGLKDLVVSTNNGSNAIHFYIYENTSGANIAFTERANRTLPSIPATPVNLLRSPRKIKIADMDGDGRKDIIIGNERDNKVFIYLNNGSFSFATPVSFSVPGLTDVGGIDVKDLNNDNLPDISVVSVEDANIPVGILQNKSSVGSLGFEASTINSLGTRINSIIGDVNGDGYPEIITSSVLSSQVSVFQNLTSTKGGNITFSNTPVNVSITNPWGLTLGDLNGDGLVDILAGTPQGVQVLTNTFNGSAISFSTVLLPTSNTSRNLKVGDINGDARPDIAIAHSSSTSLPGSFATLINRNCYVPVIEPVDLTFCPNSTFTLYATKTFEATYNWSLIGTGTLTPNGDNADVMITGGTSATVQVEIVPNNNGDGSCVNTTSQVFMLTGTTPPTAPSISASAANVVCTGESDFTLSTTAGLDNYYWTLPDGSDGPNSQILTITNLTADDAGVYRLRTQDGSGCVSDEATYEVIVNEPPFISISNLGQDDFCEGSTITLEVPNYPGFSFSWQDSGVDITGETSNTLDVTTSGAYTATISDGTCNNVSPVYNVTAVPAPVSSFTTSFMGSSTSNMICIDVPLDFTATSTGSGSFALSYDWDFGDSNTATGATTPHTYTSTAGSPYTATLTTSYTDITGCSDQNTVQITVADQVAGDIPITAVGGSTEKCPSDSILLELPQNYNSYLWSTGEETFSEYAKTGSGETEVTLTVDVVTDIGCAVTAQQTISNFANSGIGLTADQTITNDTIDLPEGIQMVTLTASNSTDGYTWTINGSVNSSTADVLTVQPTQRVTVVTVEGTDPNGCEEMSQVTILLPAVLPRKTFSPNGDGLGFDCWEILNTSALEGCKVYIFDNRGRHLLIADSPFENNCVWNGMTEGQPAPEGIYYFVMKCDDESINQTGSITLAR